MFKNIDNKTGQKYISFWINETKPVLVNDEKNDIGYVEYRIYENKRYTNWEGMGGRKFTIKLSNDNTISTNDLWCETNSWKKNISNDDITGNVIYDEYHIYDKNDSNRVNSNNDNSCNIEDNKYKFNFEHKICLNNDEDHVETITKIPRPDEELLMKSGKWMLFVKRQYAMKLWHKCIELSNKIDAENMKYWDTEKNINRCVPILIYFCPHDNEEYITEMGVKLIKIISKYFNLSDVLDDKYGRYIRYKPDILTRKGIYGGENKKASIYKLRY